MGNLKIKVRSHRSLILNHADKYRMITHHNTTHHTLHHTTPHHTTHNTTPHHTTPHHTTPYHTTHNTPHYTTLHHTSPHHTIPHHNHLIHFLPRCHGASAIIRLTVAFKNIFFICVELIIIGESLAGCYGSM